MKIIQFLALSVIIFSWISCAQLSSFQTAKTVGKENAEIGFAASGAGFTDFIDNAEDETAVLPVLEMWGRYGVGENLDVGIKLSTGLSGVFDLKYQFVGDRDSKFAMALGGGLGFQGGTLDDFILQGHIPLHMSIHPSPKFGIYLTPRFISQFIIGTASVNYGGGSFGLEFGQKVKFMTEFNYYKLLNEIQDTDELFSDFGIGLYQVGMGFKFRIGNN